MLNQQLALEQSAVIDCKSRFDKDVEHAIQINSYARTKTANLVISYTITDFTEEIKKYLKNYGKGVAVRSTLAAEVISRLKYTDTAAVVVARIIFNGLFKNRSIQSMYREIGQGLEDEWKMEQFKKENLAYYNKILADMRKRGAKSNRIKTVMNFVFSKSLDFHTEAWSVTEKFHAGMILLNLFKEATGLIEIVGFYVKGKLQKQVLPSDKLLQCINDLNSKLELLHPQFLPMVCEPKEWTGIFDGGYVSPYIKRNKLIKNNSRKYLKKLADTPMPEVYSAINHIQNTAWQINQKVLGIVETLWEEGHAIAELPDREDEAIPVFPFPDLAEGETLTEEELEVKKAWKREVYEIHKKNVQKRSYRIFVSLVLRIVRQFKDYEKIYFPYQMDFRGRIYPIPVLLQPQGSDLAKGLLRFAEGKAIKGNPDAIKWFLIHGANMFGFDKASYAERIEWINKNKVEILSFAKNPLENRGWAEADKPFQFLAWCFEYAEFIHNPDVFKTQIPIQLDGTCNGLQHYSALLKDEVGGKAVNLINSDKPSDIYEEVAKKLKNGLQAVQDNEILAKKWLELGFDRKLTKRPVMVLPYGGSEYSCREFIADYLQENYSLEYIWKHFEIGNNPNDSLFKVSLYLSKYLWRAIEGTLGAAIEGMNYLKKVASIVSAKSDYIEWKTPAGLIVRQEYKAQKKKVIRTELYGSIIRTNVNLDTDKADRRKQTNGICPNLIHSLDAACLMIYLNKCKQAGINSIMSVHDCYAVHATETELSAKLLREAFVEIYKQPIIQNFLSDIKKNLPCEVKLPALPPEGRLDIEDVYDSQYFFN